LTEFNAAHLEIQSHELVHYLLHESGQAEHDRVSVVEILGLLKLQYEILDIKTVIPQDLPVKIELPRALLSFPDKLIVVNNDPNPQRARFSALHEIGHYVLPNHQYSFYVCDEAGLQPSTEIVFEKEANEFAAELLFMADRFTIEANSAEVSASTVKRLAQKFDASFESTARRLVEKNLRPCMLVVFARKPTQTWLGSAHEDKWEAKYCVASKPFKVQYFTSVTGELPAEVAVALSRAGVDIASSISKEIAISSPSMAKSFRFKGEYFTNSYNVFMFLTPIV
jgi:hypothetical protein